jgi:hypothetical protein
LELFRWQSIKQINRIAEGNVPVSLPYSVIAMPARCRILLTVTPQWSAYLMP